MAAEKKLLLFNGRALALSWAKDMPWESNTGEGWHLYVAAYSKADAIRLIEEVTGGPVPAAKREVDVYWSKGTWGNAMAGIVPERGVWIRQDRPYDTERKPIRLR